MKVITDSFVKAPYKMCLSVLAIVFVIEIPALALKMTKMPETMETKVQQPRERAISLKLPLQQPRFHWGFMSRKDFLSGRLLLRIIRDVESTEIVIFENGQFSDGWEAMQPPPKLGKEEIYFGFSSTGRYLTAPGDKLELELTVTKDLEGMGARQTGILPAGKYKSRGTYSWLVDEFDTSALGEELAKECKMSSPEVEGLLNKLRAMSEHKAFLESWKDQWPLKITGQKGWLTDEQVSAIKAMRKKLKIKLNMQADPTPPPTDSVVIDENLFRKYLWFWIAIPSVALFAAIFFWRAFVRR